jgi:PIN domain nuclease of toxin-antitoxin system
MEKPDAPLKDPSAWWEQYVVQPKTRVIPIRAPHVMYLERLPWRHKDPYDRILMAQSAVEKMPLVTADARLREYNITTRRAAR